ncbi:hypothetical protein ACPEIF_28855 [Streptomyces sp. NPDC012600]|uniref:hypothetical protein n=1 Tax=Streptomyces sp. NPDC012600 TaxID=3415005 RepID=UPI003C2D84DF
MTNKTSARTALRTAASALIVIVTGLGAQTGWAAEAATTAPATATAATTMTEDGTTEGTTPKPPAGSGTDNNPWD